MRNKTLPSLMVLLIDFPRSSFFFKKGYETLLRLAPSYNVCFGAQIRVDYIRFNSSDYDEVITKLQTQSRIVVLFSGKTTAAHLMAATKRASSPSAAAGTRLIKLPIWIGSDGWSNRESVTKGGTMHKIDKSSSSPYSLGVVRSFSHKKLRNCFLKYITERCRKNLLIIRSSSLLCWDQFKRLGDHCGGSHNGPALGSQSGWFRRLLQRAPAGQERPQSMVQRILARTLPVSPFIFLPYIIVRAKRFTSILMMQRIGAG